MTHIHISATRHHKRDAGKCARKVFYQKIDFVLCIIYVSSLL